MRKLCYCLLLLFFAAGLRAQNVAINADGSSPDPKALLDVKSTTKGVLFPRMTEADRIQLANISPAGVPQGLIVFQTDGGADKSGLYFNASALPSIPNWKKMSTLDQLFWSFGSGPPGTIYNNDPWNIGIGTTAAAAKLHVSSASLEKLRLENTTALANGVGNSLVFKTGSYITGMIRTTGTNVNAARLGFYTFASADTANLKERMTILDNGFVGLNNATPHAPLTFASATGPKISLWGTDATANYGIGVQGSLLQVYADVPSSDIAFGYGGSAAANFSEVMRVKGNGNVGIGTTTPAEKLEIFRGRLRFRGNLTNTFAHGITWSNNAGTADRAFIGQFDDNSFGFYGYGGTGWGFLWDVNDGSLRLGTTQKAAGYILNIGGKAIAEEVRVQLKGAWPDYVFKHNYRLMPLAQLEQFIEKNKHLPNIPKADMLEKEGTDLGEMQRKMMEKIEELTLYVIELKKEIGRQQEEIQKLKEKQ